MARPIKVFIGTSAGGEDAEACAVCEHTLRANASVDVDIEWMRLSRDAESPYAGWDASRWSTPWTALRWAVPALCGWRGRAVYLDCTTIVLGDVAELVDAPFPDEACILMRRLRGGQIATSCLVFDAAASRRWLPGLDDLRADVGAHQTVGAILETRAVASAPLPDGWGHDDAAYSAVPDEVTGSVNCASPRTQPHIAHAARRLARQGRRHWYAGVRLPHFSPRLVSLFENALADAAEAGLTADVYEFEGAAWGSYDIRGARDARLEARTA